MLFQERHFVFLSIRCPDVTGAVARLLDTMVWRFWFSDSGEGGRNLYAAHQLLPMLLILQLKTGISEMLLFRIRLPQ